MTAGGTDLDLVTMTAVTETLGDQSHHHHAMICDTCGSWWFDDCVTGGLGLPVPARRDTVLCACPEDDGYTCTRAMITVPMPEADCHCTAADVNSKAVMVPRGVTP
jgi:hypothetical protein